MPLLRDVVAYQTGQTDTVEDTQAEYQSFKQQVDEQIAVAREEFEAKLRAERERALQQYRGQLPAEIEAALSQREAETRAQFEQQILEQQESAERSFYRALSIKKQQALEQFSQAWLGISTAEQLREQRSLAELRARMRIEAARSGQPYTPRTIMAYETERARLFREQMASSETMQKSQFEEELSAWASSQKQAFTESLAQNIVSTRATFETGIQEWRAKQKAELERQAMASFTEQTTEWETAQRGVFEQEISGYRLRTEDAWKEALGKYEAAVVEIKAQELSFKTWKASIPPDWKIELKDKEWVAYPQNYTLVKEEGKWIAKPPEPKPPPPIFSPEWWQTDIFTGKMLGEYSEGAAIPITETDIMLITALAFPIIAPKILPEALGITTTKIVAGAALNIGISEVASFVVTGQPLPAKQIPMIALLGEVAPIVNISLSGLVGTVAPRVVSTFAGRTALSAGIGAGYGYVLSGFKPQGALEGAIFGAAFSAGYELIAQPLYSQARLKLGVAKPMEKGLPTIGKTGEEVPTWISEPVSKLGDKRIRVVADVTELPVGTEEVTRTSLIAEYLGKEATTAHATLSPYGYRLGKGHISPLIGTPQEAAGWRAAYEWYHFYSAPSVYDEYITIYGGYMGVGRGYSGAPRLVMGGKPTALVTTETFISPEFMPLKGESIDTFLTRISTTLGGKTGIAPETVLGLSGERQVITPAKYERFGQPTMGSVFVSEGKAGSFIIQELPEGLLGRIPILRAMLSKYTSINVFLGKFAPEKGVMATTKPLIMTGAGESIISVPSKPSVSLSSFLFSPAPSVVSKRSDIISPTVYSPKVSPVSYSSMPSKPSEPLTSIPSKPSKPYVSLSTASTILDTTPSLPSLPSIPSSPLTAPSIPSTPSQPSYPSMSVGSVILQSKRKQDISRKKRVVKGVAPRFGRYGEIFPIKTESEVAEYIFGEFKHRAKNVKPKNKRRHKK